jgi:hypothetical protein
MARIARFLDGTQDVRAHQTEVDCFVQVVGQTQSFERLAHLSTFGSADRASHPKSSQSIQLDKSAAKELVTRLIGIFGSDLLDEVPTGGPSYPEAGHAVTPVRSHTVLRNR